MSYAHVGQPCRNFNILGVITIIDPRDGREKVVLSNFASGATGNLVLVDPDSGAGESIALPADEGAWALLNLDNERVLVGTCARFGYLHSLDLRSRTWAEPLRDPNESYIWNLARGSDGKVYGGTWPGCALLRYDPATHRLDNLGRVSDNPDNAYSRMVYALPGRLLVACGYAEPHLTVWDLNTGERRRFGAPGAAVREVNARVVCLETSDTIRDGAPAFYDVHTLEPLTADLREALTPQRKSVFPAANWTVPLGDGRLFVVRGQEYAIEPAQGASQTRPALAPIPAERPATRIHTLISDAQGRLWGSSAFGQTIFCYDPASGETWNSQVVCDAGGEVYGMAFIGNRLFMAAYSGGDHIVYDPAQAWNQIDNINPRALEPARPALIRPSGRSVIGPDGAFWTGWMAAYGVYGGGLSRVDPVIGAVQCWHDPVPAQAIIGLTADAHRLYFITGGQANGLAEQTAPLHCVAWSVEGRILCERVYEAGARLRAICATRAGAALAVDQRLELLDPQTLQTVNAMALPSACQMLLKWGDDDLAVFCGAQLLRARPASGELTPVCNLPGEAHAAAFTPAGELYFACERDLYRLPAGAG